MKKKSSWIQRKGYEDYASLWYYVIYVVLNHKYTFKNIFQSFFSIFTDRILQGLQIQKRRLSSHAVDTKGLYQLFYWARWVHVCLFDVFRPNRKLFTQWETSPLPLKGCRYLPICLFVFGFSFHSIFLISFGEVTIAGEGLQILTYARRLWSLSSEGHLAWNPYSDTGYPFIMVMSDSVHSQVMVTSPYEWKILEWDEKPKSNKLTKSVFMKNSRMRRKTPKRIHKQQIKLFNILINPL